MPPTPGPTVVIATGPLTSDALAADIAARRPGVPVLLRRDQPHRDGRVDRHGSAFRASRWDRSLARPGAKPAAARRAADDGEGDYLNCPMTATSTARFHDALVHGEKARRCTISTRTRFFEGCLPIEVLARRGADTLRFGPMKPIGLTDPRTGRRPYAVVQLRQENLAGDPYNLVGFQTQLKWGEQTRVLRMIPGLEQAPSSCASA